MLKNKKEFIEASSIESYDYEETKKNVDELYDKYRCCIDKADIIRKRYNSPLSLDNLGIYSTTPSDPVGNKILQMERYNKFLDTVNGVFDLYKTELSKDELIIYNKYIIERCTDEDLCEYLSLSKGAVYNRKKSCYIKVAKWFDLEVFK